VRQIRRILMLAGVAALFTAAMTGPALAGERAPTGDRIGLFGGDQSYPAGTSFYVLHGNMGVVDEDAAIGRNRFVLEVDGSVVPATYQTREEADGLMIHLWVFNFPDGMTGVHTFTGHWYAPCGVATQFLDCGPATPTTPVEYETQQISVRFISE
jgi:hypothetical protein